MRDQRQIYKCRKHFKAGLNKLTMLITSQKDIYILSNNNTPSKKFEIFCFHIFSVNFTLSPSKLMLLKQSFIFRAGIDWNHLPQAINQHTTFIQFKCDY